MRHFWALPVALRVAFAAQRPFSVHNDLLAFPQYKVAYSDSFISPEEAKDQLESRGGYDRKTSNSFEVAKRNTHEQHVLYSGISDGEEADEYEHMILQGRPYLCRIPQVAPEADDTNGTSSDAQQAEQQQELVRASDHGWTLLADLQGNCLYSATGWWMYSFCYGQEISQFHPLPPARNHPTWPPTPDPAVMNFKLGKFSKKRSQSSDLAPGQGLQSRDSAMSDTDVSTQLQTRGESNFLVQKLRGGTKCDLTGDDRQIEVQYHCNPNSGDRISLIKEVATCSYLMVIHTPRLCNDVAFLPPQTSKPNTIFCEEVVSRDEEETWRKGKAAQVAYELFLGQQDKAGTEGEEPRRRPIIGGIELGGQKLAGGSPERTIKASKLVRPPKMDPKEEKYIVTLASSDGKQTTVMNEREIRRHELTHSLEQIADYIEQTEDWAENVRPGQPWKLDVVQTANGMEYRGILMANDGAEQDDARPAESGEKSEKGSQEEYKQPDERT